MIDDKTAMIEYVIGDSIVHVFCISKQDINWKQYPIDKSKLESVIDAMPQSLSDYVQIGSNNRKAYEDYVRYAHWFYINLVAPVLKGKAEIKNLIIIADG